MVTLLLIEDNEDDALLASRLFEKLGLTKSVLILRDGEQALDYLFQRGRFTHEAGASEIKLILLDLNLPKIPGLEVLRQIRLEKRTRDIPIVVLTASRDEPDLSQSFNMGVNDYLIKPIGEERFATVCRKYLS